MGMEHEDAPDRFSFFFSSFWCDEKFLKSSDRIAN
jgi:hypothetical protein